MKVLIVTYEPYHDNSSIVGAYTSLLAVRKAFPSLQFSTEGYYVKLPVVAVETVPKGQDEFLMVTEIELDGEPLRYAYR